MHRLNRVQNAEDAPIRARRHRLRCLGYRFKSDEPDFLNSNMLTNNVVGPEINKEYYLSLDDIVSEALHVRSVGPIELLIKPHEDGEFLIWPAACPHEGGPLDHGSFVGDKIQCPWHGLTIPGLHLSPKYPCARYFSLHFKLDNNILMVAPSPQVGETK